MRLPPVPLLVGAVVRGGWIVRLPPVPLLVGAVVRGVWVVRLPPVPLLVGAVVRPCVCPMLDPKHPPHLNGYSQYHLGNDSLNVGCVQ